MRDDIPLAAAGYVEHRSLILVVSSSQTPASAPAPLADQDTLFMAALRALDEGTGGGMNYLGRYIALGDEHKRTGVEPAAVTRGHDLMMQRFERKRAGHGTLSALSATMAKKRALSREDDHEECPIDVIPPCAPPGAGGLGHESLASDPLLQFIHRVLMQIRPATDTRHVFKLKSDSDGSVTILDVGSEALRQSGLLIALAGTVHADAVVLPAGTLAIAAACALVQRAELRTSDSWFHDGMRSLGLDQDCALFASVFRVVDVLGLTLLADILSMNLESPSDGCELEILASCLSAGVPLARMLHKRLGLDDEASASAFFSRLLNTPPADLSHHDLELCDGLFLHAPQYCSLGLVSWTKRERARRKII
jgi:hypothetical protein